MRSIYMCLCVCVCSVGGYYRAFYGRTWGSYLGFEKSSFVWIHISFSLYLWLCVWLYVWLIDWFQYSLFPLFLYIYKHAHIITITITITTIAFVQICICICSHLPSYSMSLGNQSLWSLLARSCLRSSCIRCHSPPPLFFFFFFFFFFSRAEYE